MNVCGVRGVPFGVSKAKRCGDRVGASRKVRKGRNVSEFRRVEVCRGDPLRPLRAALNFESFLSRGKQNNRIRGSGNLLIEYVDVQGSVKMSNSDDGVKIQWQ